MATNNTLAGFKSINAFVDNKLSLLERTDKSMKALFGLMFSESSNTFCESTDGYRIKKLTYGESLERINRKTSALSRILEGEPKGSVVGLYMENCPEWIEFFWAVLQAGFKPLLINTRIDDDTLETVFSDFSVKAVISEGKAFGVKNVHAGDIESAEFSAKIDPDVFQNEVFLMSSNTSSHLKICAYTGERFYFQIKDSALIIRQSASIKKHYKGELKLLAFLPFYHIFGLVAVYIWFCFFSRTLVFLKDLNPKTIVNTVKKHNVTHIFAVPLFWEKIYKTAMEKIKERGGKTYGKFLKGLKISDKTGNIPPLHRTVSKVLFKEVRENIFGESISFLINGGGYVSSEVFRFFNGIGYPLVNGYGMTETGITSVELSEKPRERNLCSVGKPFASLEYKINDEGELSVRGKSLAKSIYSDGKIKETGGDWFNTHDLFAFSNGRYYVTGRKDDLIILPSGENLNPNMIEPKLDTEGIKKLCIVRGDGGAVLLAEVSGYLDKEQFAVCDKALSEKIESLKLSSMISRIVYTSTPLLGENDFKINRNKLAERYKSGALEIFGLDPGEGEDIEGGALTRRIKEIFAKAIGRRADEISTDGNFFFDLGGTSLDYFTMITSVQSEFGISFPSLQQASISTVREMVGYIKDKI